MIFATRMAEMDVRLKIDVDYVKEALSSITEDVALIFVCLDDDEQVDDAWKKKGTKYYSIVLDYNKVKNMDAEAVRHWMLRLAEERLGLVGQA